MTHPHWRRFRDRLPAERFTGGKFYVITRPDYDGLKSELGPNKSSYVRLHLTRAFRSISKGMQQHVNYYQLRHNPTKAQLDDAVNGLSLSVVEAYQVTLWDACGRRVLKPQTDLFEMMRHTKATVPIPMLKAPFTSVYIEFPTPLRDDNKRWYGAYVTIGPCEEHLLDGLEATDEVIMARGHLDKMPHHRKPMQLKMLIVGDMDSEGTYTSILDLGWDHDDPRDADTIVDDAYGTDEFSLDFNKEILRVAVNLFLFMCGSQNDTASKMGKLRARLMGAKKKTERRKWSRKIEKEMETHDLILGSTIRIPRPDYERTDGKSTGRSVRPHWRAGHHRGQWVGRLNSPERKMEIRWIWPTLVNKSLVKSENVDSEPTEYIIGR